MWPGPRSTFVPRGVLFIQPFGHKDMGRILGAVPLLEGAATQSNNVAWAEVYLRTKWHRGPSSRLATTEIGRKLGELCPFRGGGAGSTSNTKSPGRKPTSIPSGILIHPAIRPQQIWAENWWTVPLWGRGAGSPSNRICGQVRGPTRVPSVIVICPTVWPQYANLTDRGDRQTDRQTDRQRSDKHRANRFRNGRPKN